MLKVPMRKVLFSCGVLYALLLLFVVAAMAAGKSAPSHLDIMKNPEGCAACHGGRSVLGTPMLRERSETICFRCHGDRGRGKSMNNLEAVFQKDSIHPIFETGGLHRLAEKLPEADYSAERHVSCFDCHRVHVSRSDNTVAGVKGYTPGPARGDRASGRRFREPLEDYELC
jgi:predicted CXXCH cytochrome family protein